MRLAKDPVSGAVYPTDDFQRQAWVSPNIVDAAVLRKNAEDRYKDYGVRTLIHDHAYRVTCNDGCKEWPVSDGR